MIYPKKGEHVLHLRLVREVRGDRRLVVYPEIQAILADFVTQLDEILLLKLIQVGQIKMRGNIEVKRSFNSTNVSQIYK